MSNLFKLDDSLKKNGIYIKMFDIHSTRIDELNEKLTGQKNYIELLEDKLRLLESRLGKLENVQLAEPVNLGTEHFYSTDDSEMKSEMGLNSSAPYLPHSTEKNSE